MPNSAKAEIKKTTHTIIAQVTVSNKLSKLIEYLNNNTVCKKVKRVSIVYLSASLCSCAKSNFIIYVAYSFDKRKKTKRQISCLLSKKEKQHIRRL